VTFAIPASPQIYSVCVETPLCPECNRPRETFKLHFRFDQGVDPRLCLACVEGVLRRPLTLADFAQDPANSAIRKGYEMGFRELFDSDDRPPQT
jgi:hypothetical protein